MPTAKQDQEIKKRLRPLYVAAFFQGFVLWYAIEKLFMKSIGFTYESIAVATALYVVVMLLANVPFGILADRWSRKGVLHIATAALAVSSLVCGLSGSFWPYVIGISLWGLFFASYAGVYDSITYDVVLETTGKGEGFEKYYGRVQASNALALILSSLLSGFVGHYLSLKADFLLSIPFVSGAFVALYLFREPSLHRRAVTVTLSRHMRQIVSALLRSKVIIFIAISLICVGVVQRLIFEFPQLWYISLALPVVLYGPGTALILAGYGAGGFLAPKIQRSRLISFLLIVLTMLAGIGLLVQSIVIIVAAQAAVIMGAVALGIIMERYLHDELPSSIRAGASSVAGTFGYAASVPVVLGFGNLSKRYSVFAAAWLVVASLIFMLIAFGVVLVYRRNRPLLEPATTFDLLDSDTR